MSRPRLFIVSGPSGSGKGTLLTLLRERHPELFYSISATTRAPREGLEQDGVHYYFLSHNQFEDMIAQNAFIEYKRYCGNIYGTPRKPVEDALQAGRSVILEIETEGMRDAFAQYPEAVTVFISPPSLEILGQRLRGRHTEPLSRWRWSGRSGPHPGRSKGAWHPVRYSRGSPAPAAR